MKKLKKFQEYTNTNRNHWDEKLAVDDGENESLEDDVHRFVNKTSHLTTAVLRRGLEMNIL